MNAVVGKSSDISHSLSYAQCHGKDGSILLANFTDLSATPAEQASDWLATANNYRTIPSSFPSHRKKQPCSARGLTTDAIR